jgi:hypothetical protein
MSSNVNLITKEQFMPPEGAPPSPWPLAELTLSAQPAWREYYADREAVLALEKAPDVTVASSIRASFDHALETLARGDSADRALVGGWYRDAWERTFESAAAWPVAVPVAEPVPGADAAQSDAQALLARWAPDVSLPAGEPAGMSPSALTEVTGDAPEAAAATAEPGPVPGETAQPGATAVMDAADVVTGIVPAVSDKEGP